MVYKVRIMSPSDEDAWESFVASSPWSTFFHRLGWRSVIRKTYGHESFYLIAEKTPPLEDNRGDSVSCGAVDKGRSGREKLAGILPLIHLRHPFFVNRLVSMPFVDMGGVLAEDEDAAAALVEQAVLLARRIGARSVDLRQPRPSPALLGRNRWPGERNGLFYCRKKTGKVRMVRHLPSSSELLMASFKAKLRSQIRKPVREGLTTQVGGRELLEEFYDVFSLHMRDLGSPVHSKRLMENLLLEFPADTRIFIVFHRGRPVACSFALLFRDHFLNPWSSALKKYSHLSPNMLLYWTMLEYACDHGFKVFDFGRSTPGEGTYRFKEQWGARAVSLGWLEISRKQKNRDGDDLDAEKARFDMAIRLWKRMPLPLSRILGPVVRGNIGL